MATHPLSAGGLVYLGLVLALYAAFIVALGVVCVRAAAEARRRSIRRSAPRG